MKNETITIYELLGLIKDDVAPKEIKYSDINFEYDTRYKDYFDEEGISIFSPDYIIDICNHLKDNVEILPEENDEWEDICELLDDSRYNFSDRQNGMTQDDRRLLDSNFKTLGETINQLIKNQKYLKKRAESKDES